MTEELPIGSSVFGPAGYPNEQDIANMDGFVRRNPRAVGAVQLSDGSIWECVNKNGVPEWVARKVGSRT